MDDETGWNQVLVEGWGDLVRAAVCDRVDDAFRHARGVLAVAVTDPDDAPADVVERIHGGVLVAIAAETGANLDELGSQAAWATYDDTWAELARRWSDGGPMEPVPADSETELARLLAGLPRAAIEHAGAVVDGTSVRLLHTADGPVLDVEGLFRWLATDEEAGADVRARARQVIEVSRRRA